MPFDIEVDLDISAVKEEEFKDFMTKLSQSVKPGMPVMFHNYSWSDLSMGGGRHGQKFVFVSDGTVGENFFNIQMGKKNFSYVSVDESTGSYHVIKHWDNKLSNHTLSVPHSWTMDQYNEGTFSPAGPRSWQSRHSGGTESIILGNKVKKLLPEAFNAQQFAQDAIYFRLDGAYSMQNYLIHEKGDNDNKCQNERMRNVQTSRIACVRASVNLIKMITGSNIVATRAESFSEEIIERLRAEGYPVNKEDYLLREMDGNRRRMGFVKAGQGLLYGDTYILPIKKPEIEEIVRQAFLEDNVKKIYPMCNV